ncbi:MAG: ParB/RepB/Spo0J family partition protein [Gammaproteobacteria bacterium]|nr:ParB/RepB/Spo0J family partition protein [Gammaproteobacteria bacterium]
MTAKKRGLGRGLDALLGSGKGASAEPAPARAESGDDASLRHLPVDLIQRGRYQPRSDMRSDSLEELADSIRAQGVVQPVVVRPIGEERYELIAGERRWRAAQLAGLHEIPAVVRDVPDEAAVAMALIENIQRENLNPLEEARALDRLVKEFGLTHAGAAGAVGRSRAAVSNLLRLLELEAEVKGLVEERTLEMGHARALLGLGGAHQVEAARHVAARAMSVRETEKLVKRWLEGERKKSPPRPDPDIRRLEEELAGRLGARVQLRHGRGGKGRLTIEYNSTDELEGILAHIK